jgi:CNT family concentrative nucleoside transporter
MADAAPLATPRTAYPPTPFWWRVLIAAGVLALGGGTYLRDAYLQSQHMYLDLQVRSAVGIVCLLGLVACFSANLRAVNWRTILFGLGLQLLLAWLILNWEVHGLRALGIPDGFRPGHALFDALGKAVQKFIEFSHAGSLFVFGVLAQGDKIDAVFGQNREPIRALFILPPVIFVSSFFTILYFYGILQFIVRLMARAMMFLMRTSGAETLSASANVFMGQTEAPLIVKPYIPRMTQSELLALMAGGMATIAGGLMAVYIDLGANPIAVLATSVMAAPCSLYLAKLVLPETETPATTGKVQVTTDETHANVIDAAAAGAADGMRLAINVIAMLIAFLALLAMINFLLAQIATQQSLWTTVQSVEPGWAVLSVVAVGLAFVLFCRLFNSLLAHNARPPLHRLFGTRSAGQKLGNVALMLGLLALFVVTLNETLRHLPESLQLNHVFSFVFAPLSYLMGVRVEDIPAVADLLGIKIAANEFVAYAKLDGHYLALRPDLRPDYRSVVLTTYALTGFANFGSIGIQIGGIGAMAPGRRSDLARLGMTALLVGFMVTVLNAAVAGMLSEFAAP